jgi:hypothetical protein
MHVSAEYDGEDIGARQVVLADLFKVRIDRRDEQGRRSSASNVYMAFSSTRQAGFPSGEMTATSTRCHSRAMRQRSSAYLACRWKAIRSRIGCSIFDASAKYASSPFSKEHSACEVAFAISVSQLSNFVSLATPRRAPQI